MELKVTHIILSAYEHNIFSRKMAPELQGGILLYDRLSRPNENQGEWVDGKQQSNGGPCHNKTRMKKPKITPSTDEMTLKLVRYNIA